MSNKKESNRDDKSSENEWRYRSYHDETGNEYPLLPPPSLEEILAEQEQNLDDFSFEAIDFDTKFRSMNVSDFGRVHEETTAAQHVKYQPALFNKASAAPSGSLQDVPLPSKLSVLPSVILESSLTVPNKPFYLGPSQFICTLNLIDLFTRMQQKLDSILEVSYVFHQDSCRWEGVYLRGSSRCKFELNLYKESSESYIIEGNRLSGDCVPFRNICNEIHTALSSFTSSSPSSSSSRTTINNGMFTTPQALPCTDELPADEAKDALQSILAMAKSSHLESKIEASKILCDLSYQQDLHYLLCDTNCIEILIEFMQIDHEYCNQHAVCALANLSSSRTCQSSMMKSSASFVPLLFNLITDGPYHNAEMRRECARTFANLCTSHGPKIVHTVGTSCASSWLDSVEEMKDERLRLHAERAKNHLMTCF